MTHEVKKTKRKQRQEPETQILLLFSEIKKYIFYFYILWKRKQHHKERARSSTTTNKMRKPNNATLQGKGWRGKRAPPPTRRIGGGKQHHPHLFLGAERAFQENEVANLANWARSGPVFLLLRKTQRKMRNGRQHRSKGERDQETAPPKRARGTTTFFTSLHSTFYFYLLNLFFTLFTWFLKHFRKSFFSNVSPCCPLFALFPFWQYWPFATLYTFFFALSTPSSPFFYFTLFGPFFWTPSFTRVYPLNPFTVFSTFGYLQKKVTFDISPRLERQ